MMYINYRLGTIEDLNEINSLVYHAIKEMESKGIKQWDEMYPTQEDFINDIEAEQLYVGLNHTKLVVIYVLNQECDEEYKNGQWKDDKKVFYVIHRLCVNPLFQNKGIARITMEHIEKEAHGKGVKAIRLDVFSKNPYALKLYDACGYCRVGTVEWRKGEFFLMEKYL